MKICVTQRDGIRNFSKFANISERDKLEIELRIEDKDCKPIVIDLTSALIEEYAKHPEIGRVDPEALMAAATRTHKPVTIKKVQSVSPAYLSESKREKDDMVARVREAQYKAADEMKQKKAAIAAARAERLVEARKIKAEKEEAEKKKLTKKIKITAKETISVKTKAAKSAVAVSVKPTQKAAKVVELKKTTKPVAKIETKTKAKAKVAIDAKKIFKAPKASEIKKISVKSGSAKTPAKPVKVAKAAVAVKSARKSA